jgi:hypothetical protein
MRAEDKQLEGPELEREHRVEQSRQEAHEEEELPVLAGEQVRDVELDHRSRLLDALQLILAREQVTLSLLYLPRRETQALEFLQTAVTGHDPIGEFVFAEDRQSMLEQALAVLQQNLTYGDPAQLAELHGKFDAMTGRVAALRSELVNLENAQQELIEGRDRGMQHETDEADKPKPKPEELDDVTAGGSTLTGPERAPEPTPPSTLTGPERPEERKPPSTLTGPERPAEPRPPSTLGGPERSATTAPSTLGGPELPAPRKPASTLGAPDPAEAGDPAAKKPWWKRPFG